MSSLKKKKKKKKKCLSKPKKCNSSSKKKYNLLTKNYKLSGKVFKSWTHKRKLSAQEMEVIHKESKSSPKGMQCDNFARPI